MRAGAAHTVTCNLDALLLENEALRHQVRLLRQELAMLQGNSAARQASAAGAGREAPPERPDGRRHRAAQDPFARPPGRSEGGRTWRSGPEVTTGAAPGITPQLVRQWAEALSSHPRWRELRLGSRLEGDPAAGGCLELGLQALLDDLRSRSHNPALELEEALDRRSPGLGSELRQALAGPASRSRAAVRACFALHGPRAADLLSRDAAAVVEELLAAIARLESRVRQEHAERRKRAERQRAWGQSGSQSDGRRPGGRSWGDTGAGGANADAGTAGSGGSRDDGSKRAWSTGSGGSRGSSGSGAAPGAGAGEGRSSQNGRHAAPDRQRDEALAILELAWGASPAAVKAAHRRLVKVHHPDMGGDAESFRRINDAYQLLIA
jgi:hypothetical protein